MIRVIRYLQNLSAVLNVLKAFQSIMNSHHIYMLDSLCESTKSNNTSEQSLIKTATWLLSNLCQYTDSFEIVSKI